MGLACHSNLFSPISTLQTTLSHGQIVEGEQPDSRPLLKQSSWEQTTALVRTVHLTHSSQESGHPGTASPLLPLLVCVRRKIWQGLLNSSLQPASVVEYSTTVLLYYSGVTTLCLWSRDKTTISYSHWYLGWVCWPCLLNIILTMLHKHIKPPVWKPTYFQLTARENHS